MCYISQVTCHLSPITCHLCQQPWTLTLLTPTLCTESWFAKNQKSYMVVRKKMSNCYKKRFHSFLILVVRSSKRSLKLSRFRQRGAELVKKGNQTC